MNAIEQARFNALYATMLCAMQLQGKAEKTREAYAQGLRCTAGHGRRLRIRKADVPRHNPNPWAITPL
ncbi:MAG: hypothetical protein IPN92_18995 [Chromatiaceae bacterium]|nr:hypothetical protein [Chromatiaceae bacterium]